MSRYAGGWLNTSAKSKVDHYFGPDDSMSYCGRVWTNSEVREDPVFRKCSYCVAALASDS